MTNDEKSALAYRMDAAIRERIGAVRKTKIEVYLLLREFKRLKLYRRIDVEICRTHAGKICAERRFPTWEDYLAGLGACGISFGYFAELERLERRFGTEFVRLCGVGIRVEARRALLGAPQRVVDEVQGILASGGSDEQKIASLESAAAISASEQDRLATGWQSPHQRVSRYRRHVARWQKKLSVLVDQIAQVPRELRAGPAYYQVVWAWREVFEQHVEIGERLARRCLSPHLGLNHVAFLGQVREGWARSPFDPRLAETARAA